MKFDYPKGATPIDDDELADLIPWHITLQSELNEWEGQNILEANTLLGAKEFKYKDILTFDFLLYVHKLMFDRTWKWAGKTRKSMKNIGVDVSRIFEQTKYLCDDTLYWIEHNTFPADEIGVRFHHRLVLIHLFPNGNGRHSRLVTDILMRSIGQPIFSWGSKDLYHEGEIRKKYIIALVEADKNNYMPLLNFVR